jgi:hypothetical protein
MSFLSSAPAAAFASPFHKIAEFIGILQYRLPSYPVFQYRAHHDTHASIPDHGHALKEHPGLDDLNRSFLAVVSVWANSYGTSSFVLKS